ncbi:MAG: hypothetical protein AB7O96_05790 [Pseudobdellovibrionaceae bacterium]
MKKLALSILATVALYSLNIWAQPPAETERFKLQESAGQFEIWDKEKNERFGSVSKTAANTIFYHWGSSRLTDYLQAEGKVPATVVEKGIDENYGHAGGGFYISESPLDSAKFGDSLSVVKTTSETTTLIIDRVYSETPFILAQEEAEKIVRQLVQLGIQGISVKYPESDARFGFPWLNIVDAAPMQKARAGKLSDIISYLEQNKNDLDSMFKAYGNVGIISVPITYYDYLNQSKQLQAMIEANPNSAAELKTLQAWLNGEDLFAGNPMLTALPEGSQKEAFSKMLKDKLHSKLLPSLKKAAFMESDIPGYEDSQLWMRVQDQFPEVYEIYKTESQKRRK